MVQEYCAKPRNVVPDLWCGRIDGLSIQASVQSVHGAVDGNLLVSPRLEKVGGSGQLRHVPTRDDVAISPPARRSSYCLGPVAGEVLLRLV